MTKTAYLRVYVARPPSHDDEVPLFLRTYGLLSEGPSDDDWVAEWRGTRLVCPRHLQLRILESTVAFANTFRGLGSGLIPESAARAATRELKAYRRAHPEARVHVLTSAWHVPVRWFTAFHTDEREVYDFGGRPRLRFRTDTIRARRRVKQALAVLTRLQVFQAPAEELSHLLGWLEEFPADSMLELDYDTVSDLFDPQDLVLDDSVELVHESLEALQKGDMMRAGESYGRVVTRWAPAYSVTFSS